MASPLFSCALGRGNTNPMLSLACALIVLLVTFGLTGMCCLRACNAHFERPGDGAFAAMWIGAGVTGLLVMGVSLAVPLGWSTGVVLALALSVVSLSTRATRDELRRMRAGWNYRAFLAFGALLLSSSLYMSQPVSLDDTGLYHYGATRWLAEHGAVRGLALLHHRFGFASTWFALSALFDHGPLEGRMVVVMNAFAFLVTLLMGVVVACRQFWGEGRISDFFFLAAGIPVAGTAHFFHPIGISGSPNYPVMLLTVAVAWAILVQKEGEVLPGRRSGHVDSRNDSSYAPLLMAVGAAGIKVLTAPLVVATFAQYSLAAPRPAVLRRLVVGGISLALLTLPIAAFGWVVSGCLLFPASWTCTNGPWSVVPARAAEVAQSVGEWSRWLGPTPATASALSWFAPWLRGGVAPKSAVAGAGALGLMVLGVWLAAPKRRSGDGWRWFGPWCAPALLAFWCAGFWGVVAFAVLAAAAFGCDFFPLLWRDWRAGLPPVFRRYVSRLGAAFAAAGVALFAWILLSRALNVLYLAVPCLALSMPGRPFAGRRWLLGLGLSGIIFTLYGAPSVWYSLGYISVVFGVWATGHREALVPGIADVASRFRLFQSPLLPATLQLSLSVLLLLALVPLDRQAMWPFFRLAPVGVNLLEPATLPRSEVRSVWGHGFLYSQPVVSDQCWAARLPCTPEDASCISLLNPPAGIGGGFAVVAERTLTAPCSVARQR